MINFPQKKSTILLKNILWNHIFTTSYYLVQFVKKPSVVKFESTCVLSFPPAVLQMVVVSIL